jgi:hypothetical protein
MYENVLWPVITGGGWCSAGRKRAVKLARSGDSADARGQPKFIRARSGGGNSTVPPARWGINGLGEDLPRSTFSVSSSATGWGRNRSSRRRRCTGRWPKAGRLPHFVPCRLWRWRAWFQRLTKPFQRPGRRCSCTKADTVFRQVQTGRRKLPQIRSRAGLAIRPGGGRRATRFGSHAGEITAAPKIQLSRTTLKLPLTPPWVHVPEMERRTLVTSSIFPSITIRTVLPERSLASASKCTIQPFGSSVAV